MLIRPLVHIWEELVLEVPEVVFRFDGSCYGILYLLGGLLVLLGNGAIVNQNLQGLLVFALKHHFQLLPASLHGVSFFGIDVEGLQEVSVPGVESLPVL